MSLTESEDVFECVRQNTESDQETSDIKPDIKAEVNTTSISSVTTSSGKENNPEEDYIKNHLKKFTWYHGMMFGNIVEKMLKWENSFLVRRFVHKGTHKYLCISVRINQKVAHCSLNQNEQGWSCPKLIERFPKINKKRFLHIYQIIDNWSSIFPSIIPVPRRSMVLQHNSITLENKLGHGAFGEVFKAKFHPSGASQPIEVAVKRVIGDVKRAELQEFCHEASIMAVLQHENIVTFYGIASLEEPFMVVMEMVTGGDLKKYLQTTPNISKLQIIYFALNIACGMRHLASKNVIHRDLAARNCLINKDLKVKISDFGLSIFGTDVIQKRLKKAPIRWLSPETLTKGVFNEKTDVWSFGVVLTELMTRCENNPLHQLKLNEATEWIKGAEWPHRITNGEPKELMEIVDMCCHKNPEIRINFSTAKRRIHALYVRIWNTTTHGSLPLSPNLATVPLEMKKSEDRTKTTPLARKKSFDGLKSKTATVKRVFTSFRRKSKETRIPSGMTMNSMHPSPPTASTTTASPSTGTTTSSGPPTPAPSMTTNSTLPSPKSPQKE